MATKTYPIPPPNPDFTTTWAFLKEGLGDIMTKPQTGMSHHRYMALSTASYNYCTSPSPIRKFLQTHAPTTQSLSPPVRRNRLTIYMRKKTTAGCAEIMGSDLYKNLVGFLGTHLRTLKDVSFPNR